MVYLIMVALYESVVYPFVVLFSIPVALIGALLALALTMESLTIFAIVGLIMLLGLVAKNGILIVDFTNHLKEQGMSVAEALVEAGAIVVGVAVIVERGAEPKIKEAGYEYRAAYQLSDLGL